ncbi:MAG: hypothetical protein ACKO43_00625 [Alphaproteobacteria bacterium]
MTEDDTTDLENLLANNPNPSNLQIYIKSAVRSQSKNQIALIAQHIRQRLSSRISADQLIKAIDDPK